jgi:hypothetical protein
MVPEMKNRDVDSLGATLLRLIRPVSRRPGHSGPYRKAADGHSAGLPAERSKTFGPGAVPR